MDRHDIAPRSGWPAIVEEQGLVFWRTELPSGEAISYWHESAYYSLTGAEVYDLEATARVLLNDLLVAAGDFVLDNNLFSMMGIPGWAVPAIRQTWIAEPPMLYGRFDFAYGHDNVPKLLEFNADTPTALVETAVVQWEWAQAVFGDGVDQWNSLHEALVARWQEMNEAGRLRNGRVHFLHTTAERSGEDFMTCGYLVETAREAGVQALLLPIEQLGLHDGYGFVDARGDPVRVAFKLYPWEWMVHERFCAAALERMGDEAGQTLWIEPIWKMLWSNKGILAVLWHLFPDHPSLLPTYFCKDTEDGRVPVDVFGNRLDAAAAVRLGESFVEKPLLAREGANAKVVIAGEVVDEGPDQDYGDEGFVLQRYTDLGRYRTAGARPVLGVWVVDMEPAGLGIRESDSYITDNMSRFVPHVIAG